MPVVCMTHLVDLMYGELFKELVVEHKEKILAQIKEQAKEQCLCDDCQKEREPNGD